jgi:enterochelin esterase-like enzyme
MSVEKRLLKDPKIAERYVTAIEKYVFDGHARLLATSELGGAKKRVWYLPHHYVINPNKPNKIRVVFDGAAKFQDTSLNYHLLHGSVLLANLVGILIRS